MTSRRPTENYRPYLVKKLLACRPQAVFQNLAIMEREAREAREPQALQATQEQREQQEGQEQERQHQEQQQHKSGKSSPIINKASVYIAWGASTRSSNARATRTSTEPLYIIV